MKYITTKSAVFSRACPARDRRSGFSLVELMVAMAIFLVVGGAVVNLVRRHMPLFNTSQNQAQINITLRNAVAQMQMEVVNAGSGYSAINPMPASPVGITTSTKTTPITTCKAAPATYVTACFDQLNIISADGNIPALTPSKDAGATLQIDTNTTGTLYLTYPGNAAKYTAADYLAWAGRFAFGDEIVLVQGGTDFVNSQPAMTVLTLNAPGAQSGLSVKLSYATTTTLAGCPVGPANTITTVGGVPTAKDALGIYDPSSKDSTYGVPLECGRFTNLFNPGIDYAIRLTSTNYSVDTTDPTNPKLLRTYTVPPVAPAVAATVVKDVIAEQIIGFNVDAWSSKLGAAGTYSSNSDSTTYSRDWASLHSVKVQVVARATPNTDNSNVPFKNSYDQGNYQVQGISVVINPRNLNTN